MTILDFMNARPLISFFLMVYSACVATKAYQVGSRHCDAKKPVDQSIGVLFTMTLLATLLFVWFLWGALATMVLWVQTLPGAVTMPEWVLSVCKVCVVGFPGWSVEYLFFSLVVLTSLVGVLTVALRVKIASLSPEGEHREF